MPVTRSGGRRLGVLISGRGSNLQSIIDAVASGALDATIAVVISNRSDAAGLQRARDAGIDALCLSPRDYPGREAYDRAIAGLLRARQVDLVCLAGYMRLVGTPLLEAFPERILNIHPSLLPSFPGLAAITQAWEHGVRVSGCTVHLVDAELDHGPVVAQAAVEIRDDDTLESFETRIHEAEHRLYPMAVSRFLTEPWRIEGRRLAFGAGEKVAGV
jgi:phosphoribosylglycinamide formyltransferase-1